MSICPKCSREFSPEATGGFCPACLLLQALDKPVGESPADVGPGGEPLDVPEQIGPYTLVAILGEGGMGTVYRAEQFRPIRRTVALKLIRSGQRSKEMIARFDAERQTLARLDHPNIAKVFDAGTTEAGQPYVVMEYFAGVPITKFADTQRLTIGQRIELFIQVCDAIAHAHGKILIHRDIKAHNVLACMADGKPTAKVIDFGIAKALGTPGDDDRLDDSWPTQEGIAIGTLIVMSPEQASGSSDVDTRTDVYSLGVLLYELLSGELPFDPTQLRAAGLIEFARIMREVEAPKPSVRANKGEPEHRAQVAHDRGVDPATLVRALRGDLDSVVMKAIEKDRSRRYTSVGEFRDDLSRFQRGDPVAAGPTNTAYVLRKLVRRHRVALTTAAAIVLLLVAGLAATSWELVRARRAERAEAAAHADAVQKLWQSYLDQAQYGRTTLAPGQRIKGLAVCEEAARIRPTLEVRNEAIACLAMDDVKLIKTIDVPQGKAEYFAFDRAMKQYAQCDSAGSVTIRGCVDDHAVCTLPSFGGRLGDGFDFSPDGQYLMMGYRGGPVSFCVWNLRTQKPAIQFAEPLEQALSVDFSPDSKSITMAKAGGLLAVYDIESGRQVRSFDIGAAPGRVVYSPNGSELAVCCEPHEIRIISADNGALLTTLQTPAYVDTVAWHPGGDEIATCGAEVFNPIYILNRHDGRQVAVLHGHIGKPVALFYTSHGNRLVSSGWDNTIRLWNPFTAEQLLSIDGRGFSIYAGADQETFGASSGLGGARFRIVESQDFRQVIASQDDGYYSTADVSPDGKLLAGACAGCVRFWNMATGVLVGNLNIAAARTVLFTPDGRNVLVSVPGKILKESVPDQIMPDAMLDRTRELYATGAVALSADGQTVVYDKGEGTLMQTRLSDLGGESLVAKQFRAARFIAVSPDGRWAATSIRADVGVKVWDLRSSTLAANMLSICPIHECGNVCFSPDGKWLLTEDLSAFRSWEVGSWKLRYQIDKQITYSDASSCFSPDGKYLALVYKGTAITLVDPSTGTELASLTAPPQRGRGAISFSPDSQQLVVTEDPWIGIWDLRQLKKDLVPLGVGWR